MGGAATQDEAATEATAGAVEREAKVEMVVTAGMAGTVGTMDMALAATNLGRMQGTAVEVEMVEVEEMAGLVKRGTR